MQDNHPSSEEIARRREFKYRAFSPDSEPPSPLHEEDKSTSEPPKEERQRQPGAADRDGKRQDS